MSTRLNGICPYFTMFPLTFPLGVLNPRFRAGDKVLDPFAGRGTTNYAARLLGLYSVAIDSSAVATAITEAKLANTTPNRILAAARQMLTRREAPHVPEGEFWSLAFHPTVLEQICRLREALLKDCQSDSRKALRGVLLGALHGPSTKSAPSHFSNQCLRTFAPKPGYAVNFWRSRGLEPPPIDVLEVIRRRSDRYYTDQPRALGSVLMGDSRSESTFQPIRDRRFRWIITSPPYYGMRTYIPDQWLRNWFLGGPPEVDYTNDHQLDHPSPEAFARQLSSVWSNVASVADDRARLVVRYGGIPDRSADPIDILKSSMRGSPWRLQTIKPAGSPESGRRQSKQFTSKRRETRQEYDAWAALG